MPSKSALQNSQSLGGGFTVKGAGQSEFAFENTAKMTVESSFLFNELLLSKRITKRDSLTFTFMSRAKVTVESPFLFNKM